MPKSKYTKEIANKLLKINSAGNPELEEIQNEIKGMQQAEEALLDMEKKVAKNSKSNVEIPIKAQAVFGTDIKLRRLMNSYISKHAKNQDAAYEAVFQAYGSVVEKCKEDEVNFNEAKLNTYRPMAVSGFTDLEVQNLAKNVYGCIKITGDYKKSAKDSEDEYNKRKDEFVFDAMKIAYLSKLGEEYRHADNDEWKKDIINELYSDNLDENVQKFIENDPMGKHIHEYLSKNMTYKSFVTSFHSDGTEKDYSFADRVRDVIGEALYDYAQVKYNDHYYDYDKPNLTDEEKKTIENVANEIDKTSAILKSVAGKKTGDLKDDIVFDTMDIKIRANIYGKPQSMDEAPEVKDENEEARERRESYLAEQSKLVQLRELKEKTDTALRDNEFTHKMSPEEIRENIKKTTDIDKMIGESTKLINDKFADLVKEDELRKDPKYIEEQAKKAGYNSFEREADPEIAGKMKNTIENDIKAYENVKKNGNAHERELFFAERKQREIQRRKNNPDYTVTEVNGKEVIKRKEIFQLSADEYSKEILETTQQMAQGKINVVEWNKKLNNLKYNNDLSIKYKQSGEIQRPDRSDLKEAGLQMDAYMKSLVNGNGNVPEPDFMKKEAPKKEEAPKVEEVPKNEEVPKKEEEGPKVEEVPKKEEEGPKKEEEGPKKEEGAPKKEEAPKNKEENQDNIILGEEDSFLSKNPDIDRSSKFVFEDPDNDLNRMTMQQMIKSLKGGEKGVWGGTEQYSNIYKELEKIKKSEDNLELSGKEDKKAWQEIINRKRDVLMDMDHYIARKYDEKNANKGYERENSKKRRELMEKVRDSLTKDVKAAEKKYGAPDRSMRDIIHEMEYAVRDKRQVGTSKYFEEVTRDLKDLNVQKEAGVDKKTIVKLESITLDKMNKYLYSRKPQYLNKQKEYNFSFGEHQNNKGKPSEPFGASERRFKVMLQSCEKLANIFVEDLAEVNPQKSAQLSDFLKNMNVDLKLNIKTEPQKAPQRKTQVDKNVKKENAKPKLGL